MGRTTEKHTSAGEAGLCPAGAAATACDVVTEKEGAHGGTMGSPMFEMTGRYQSPDYFTLD